MFGRHSDESWMLTQIRILLRVVPLPERASTMGTVRQIALVGWQTTNQRTVHTLAHCSCLYKAWSSAESIAAISSLGMYLVNGMTSLSIENSRRYGDNNS